MAKNQLENDSSLLPTSDEREDSGLQDILSVAAKIKDSDEDDLDDAANEGEDSGVIMFRAGDLEGESEGEVGFGAFAGGLGAGFDAPAEPLTSPDLTPLGGEGRVKETSAAAEPPKPTEEPKRNPLTVLAVVLGLGLAAAGIVYFLNDDAGADEQQQVHAEMSAKPDEAAVGKAEPTSDEDPAAASAGVVEPEPEPEPEPELVEGETEGALEGEDAGGLLADEGDADDPMAQKAGLLGGGTNPVNKAGKWDQGTSNKAAANSEPDPEPAPKADPQPDPTPDPEPVKKSGGSASEDEIECLLNPDLPKCNTGGSSKPKKEEILAPKLPEKLSQSQLKSGFNTVKSKAKSCGSQHGAEEGTKVRIHVSIEGATGKVSAVQAKGEHAGTPLGKCVEDAVEKATFEQFKMGSQGADFSYIM
ncbi:MAG: hypothetical protein R6X02_34315 [Enhygromyxa sp.]